MTRHAAVAAVLATRQDPADMRKAALAIVGVRQKEVADALGVTRQAVGGVIAGDARSDRIEKYLCQVLNVAHARLFPEHYGPERPIDPDPDPTNGGTA